MSSATRKHRRQPRGERSAGRTGPLAGVAWLDYHALAIKTNYVCLDFQALGGTIMRTIRAISPTEIELTAVLKRPDRPPERVGEARLTRADCESPFRVRSRKVLAQPYGGLLISGSGDTSDNKILREGYRWY